MKYIRLAIVGGREFSDYELLKSSLKQLQKDRTVIQVVSGGARGADTLGERWADENGIDKKIFPAQWDRYGKHAGFIRNKDIVRNCDEVIAFWDGKSRGTADTIATARLEGKKVTIINF